MARPTYTYKGFKLYIACPAVYSIARLDDTYAKMSAKNGGESYGKMSAREAFYRWVDENYGDAYARKN